MSNPINYEELAQSILTLIDDYPKEFGDTPFIIMVNSRTFDEITRYLPELDVTFVTHPQIQYGDVVALPVDRVKSMLRRLDALDNEQCGSSSKSS